MDDADTVPVKPADAQPLRMGLIGTFMLVVAYLAGSRWGWDHGRLAGPTSTLALTAVPLAAGVATWRRARLLCDQARSAWQLVAVAMTAWALGEATYGANETWGGGAVFPSPADALFLLAGFVFVLAFARLPTAGSTRRLLAAVEALLVADAVFLVSWSAGLRVVVEDAGGSSLSRLATLLYPGADVFVIAVLILGARRTYALRSTSTRLLLLGVGLLATADITYALQLLHDAYRAGSPVDVAWMAGFALVGLAALSAPTDAAASDRVMGPVARFTPQVAAMVGYAAATVDFLRGEFHAVTFIGVSVLVAVGVTRQVLAMRDVDRLAAEAQERERHFRSLVQGSSDVITITDVNGVVTWISPSVRAVFGHDAAGLPGGAVTDLVHPDDRASGFAAVEDVIRTGRTGVVRARVRHADGRYRHTESTISNQLGNASVSGVVLSTRDTTERSELEEQLHHHAYHDSLTGRPNRLMFREAVDDDSQRRFTAVAVADLDGFKDVNDTWGHDVGDRLLGVIADRLTQLVRPGDIVARLGGDEFAVAFGGGPAGSETMVAQHLVDAVNAPVVIDGVSIHVGLSVGMAPAAAGLDSGELLRRADLAMYVAKRQGGNRIAVFDPAEHDLRTETQLTSDFIDAVGRGALYCVFQPIVNITSHALQGFEVLARWHHDELGPISPAVFVPLAERTGMQEQLTDVVLHRAFATLVEHTGTGEGPWVSVNLFSTELNARLRDRVVLAAERTGMPLHRLVVEVTETAAVSDVAAARNALQQLRAIGVRVALDDFGTGFSGLSALAQLPVDLLKIDRSFLAALPDMSAQSIVHFVARLSRQLNLDVIAEGVETGEQLATVRRLGCRLAQGFHCARPAAFTEHLGLLERGDIDAELLVARYA